MSAFDELYVRFFKAAVKCHISAECYSMEPPPLAGLDLATYWGAQAMAYGLCARDVGQYLSEFKRRQLEGMFFKGQFTIGSAGEVRLYDAPATK